MPPAVLAEGLRKEYGRVVALDGVDVRIEQGELVAVLGPNGAGKSTFVKIVCGVTTPTSGKIEVLGGDPSDPAVKRRVGILPQEGGLYPEMTVRENLRFYSRLYGKDPDPEPIRRLGVDGFLDRRVWGLSGGMKKRAALAITLSLDPELLVLDEPTNELDPLGRKDLLEEVKKNASERTIMYVSHDVYEVEQLEPDRLLIFLNGRIALNSSFDEVMDKYGSVMDAYEGVSS